MGALAEHGAHPAGPPFAKYTGMPSETVDVEAGFPVAAPFDAPGLTDGDGVEAGGRVEAGTLPGGRTAVGTHVGPYEGLTDTYQQMAGWISAQGLIPGPAVWEVYLSDPGQEPDPATWRTEVYWPATEGGAS
jgi:effector-binding domain-containing protein